MGDEPQVIIFQLLGGTAFLAVSLALYALFEYWRMISPTNQYLLAAMAAAVAMFTASTFYASMGESKIARAIRGGVLFTIVAYAVVFATTNYYSRTELNRILGTKTRCESLILPILKDEGEYEYTQLFKSAQDNCRLRLFQETLKSLNLIEGESRIVQAAKYMQSENRLNDTALVILMSSYSEIQEKRFLSEKNPTPISYLQNEFAVYEAEFSLIAVYNVKTLSEEETDPNAEAQKIKKILELSTLGRTLHVLQYKTFGVLQDFYKMLGDSKQNGSQNSAELSLLQIRADKLRDNYNRLIKRWDLSGKLESLRAAETYPQQYPKLRADVQFDPL